MTTTTSEGPSGPSGREEITPSLPTWVEILADMRQELRALAERVARLERGRAT